MAEGLARFVRGRGRVAVDQKNSESERGTGEKFESKAIQKPFVRRRLAKCEWIVKVFNSSVEIHVEKDAARLRITRPARA
jgi:hypothetical protein